MLRMAQAMGPEAKICLSVYSFGILERATAFRETQSSCGVNLTRLLIWIEISIKYSDLKVIVVRNPCQPMTPIA